MYSDEVRNSEKTSVVGTQNGPVARESVSRGARRRGGRERRLTVEVRRALEHLADIVLPREQRLVAPLEDLGRVDVEPARVCAPRAGLRSARARRARESGADAQKSRLRTPPLFVAPSIELPRRCSALYRSWPARTCGEGDDDEAPLGEMRPSGTSGWIDPVLKSARLKLASLLAPPARREREGGAHLGRRGCPSPSRPRRRSCPAAACWLVLSFLLRGRAGHSSIKRRGRGGEATTRLVVVLAGAGARAELEPPLDLADETRSRASGDRVDGQGPACQQSDGSGLCGAQKHFDRQRAGDAPQLAAPHARARASRSPSPPPSPRPARSPHKHSTTLS